MIQVQFESCGPGTCGWCMRERGLVYTVTFSDKSFVGPMCKVDLLRAIGMKVGVTEPKRAAAPAVVPVNNVAK